jgi:hypothetical protein
MYDLTIVSSDKTAKTGTVDVTISHRSGQVLVVSYGVDHDLIETLMKAGELCRDGRLVSVPYVGDAESHPGR